MPRLKHGMYRSVEYKRWVDMNSRVKRDPKYTSAGTTVCDEWRWDFAAFYRDMGPIPSPKHTLDRIDGSKGYHPDNCRWATYAEQNANLSSNVKVGDKHLAAISRELGMSHNAVSYRVRHGLDLYAPKQGMQDHCRAGHPFDDDNTYWAEVRTKQGGTRLQRYCRACRAQHQADLRARRK
jgi:hypothetical protein